jgi:hypothetical protein
MREPFIFFICLFNDAVRTMTLQSVMGRLMIVAQAILVVHAPV